MKTILVYYFEGMVDFEISLAVHLLGADAGFNVVSLADEMKEITSRSGLLYKPHKKTKEAMNMKVEGIIIPGGWNENISQDVLDLIRKLYKDKKLLAAICAGPIHLAKAGILDYHQYTTAIAGWTQSHGEVFGTEDPFPRQNYKEQRVVVDGNVITSKGMAFVDFSMALCDYFHLFEDEEERNAFDKSMKGL